MLDEQSHHSADLSFYSAVTASYTHDIKNILAVINENAGLLGDLVAMQARGLPLSPEKLTVIVDKFQRQVKRADELTKKLNLLAHSTDQSIVQCDLVETLSVLLKLTERLHPKWGACFQLEEKNLEPKSVKIPQFLFFHVLWLLLKLIASWSQRGTKIQIDATGADGQVIFCFSGFDSSATIVSQVNNDELIQFLLQRCGATIVFHLESSPSLTLTIQSL